jgi:Transposase IS66 family
MKTLWALEDRIRGKAPELRRAARQEHSAPVVQALWALWESELPRVPGKSKTAEAIRYAIGRRDALERFLHDGRLDIDNNTVERAIRPQTITRKNALFAGSDGGATYCSSGYPPTNPRFFEASFQRSGGVAGARRLLGGRCPLARRLPGLLGVRRRRAAGPQACRS